jgi:tetratricopeptide (TPR) repeat protein
VEKYLSKNWLCCAFIGLFALLLWGQTARFAFVWDDEVLIVHNKSIRSLKNIPEIFTSKNAQASEPTGTFRPIRTAFYALLYAIDGHPAPQPWIFHVANVLWHAIAAMLLFSVALLLCQGLAGETPLAARITALLIALAFAAQPVNAEAVCWVKCMDDLMAGVFVLAAARSLLKWNEGGHGYVAALVWFLLAAFSKESAAPFALASFFILRGVHKLPWRRCARLTVPFLLVTIFYAVWRHLVMGRSSMGPPLSGTYAQTLIDMFPVAPKYLRLLCGIPPFCADYSFMVSKPSHPFFSGGVLGGMFLVLTCGALAAWMWRRPQWRMSAFGLLWIAMFLLPVSNLVPMVEYMADRFLYLPLMGFLLALGGACLNFSRLLPAAAAKAAAAVAKKATKAATAAMTAVADAAWAGVTAVAKAMAEGVAALTTVTLVLVATAVVVVWTGMSLTRTALWKSDLTLFVGTDMECPGIKRVEDNAVATIFDLPQIKVGRMGKILTVPQAEQMIAILQKTRWLFPDNDVLTAQIGLTDAKIGRWQEAVEQLELATQQNPASAERWFDLASVYWRAVQLGKAREACAQALRLNPQYEAARRLQAKLELKAAAPK